MDQTDFGPPGAGQGRAGGAAPDRFGRAPRPRPVPPQEPPFPGTESVDPERVFRGPGYTAPTPPSNGTASTALWFTLAGVFLPPLLLVSLILGAIGLIRAPRLAGVGGRAAGGALAVSLVLLGLWGLVWILLATF